jgi:hypothetical protein
LCRPITHMEYNEAVVFKPKACPLFAMGDLRSGLQVCSLQCSPSKAKNHSNQNNDAVARSPANMSQKTCTLKNAEIKHSQIQSQYSYHLHMVCSIHTICYDLQLLEDFAVDSRRTVRQMAENRRGSPVLRRIASALCTMSCRLETRMMRFKSPASTSSVI